MKLQVFQLRLEADDIVSVVLRDPSGAPLPAWSPGAHIALTLPSGVVRQYSLCGPPGEHDTYTVAVLRVHDGRGGSQEVHDRLRPGMVIEVGEPRNDFELQPAPHYLFVAGGIGITPILSMTEHLRARLIPPDSMRVIYGARSRSAMAFTDRLHSPNAGYHVEVVPQDEDGLPDIAAAVAAVPAGTALYCCGPPAMLAAVTEIAATRPDVTLHIERFTASAPSVSAPGDDQEFEVELVRSGVTVTVPAGKSVLDAVLEVAPDTPFSCTSGFCGTCETKIIAGSVDHRDEMLTEAERAANRTMMICVSRANGAKLTLDL